MVWIGGSGQLFSLFDRGGGSRGGGGALPLPRWLVPLVGENKGRSLNTGNCDVVSDNIKHDVETREKIARVKPDLLS